MMIRRSFTLDSQRDAALLAWLDAQPNSSETVRAALRHHYDESQVTLADVYRARRLDPDGRIIMTGGPQYDDLHKGSTSRRALRPKSLRILVVTARMRSELEDLLLLALLRWARVNDHTVTIKLLQGDVNGELVASTTVQSGLESYDWTYAEVEGKSFGTIITVVWEMTGTAGGAHGSHADGLEFVMIAPGCPDPFADIDNDGDVDQEDFGHFQACLTGTSVAVTDPDCQDASFDGDSDVDRNDFVIFQACMSGPDVPADPGCTD